MGTISARELIAGGLVDAARQTGMSGSMFEAIKFTGLTNPANYGAFITQIETLLAGTGIEKNDLGASTDGGSRLYNFIAGRRNDSFAQTILFNAGMHSDEPLGQLANIVYFVWVATSDDARARAIRSAYKLILLPNANPFAFRGTGGGRLNASGVNLNRNFDFMWSIYDAGGDATNYKGTSAFSEQESQIIKKIFDDHNVVLAIDSHNMETAPNGVDPNIIQVGAPSTFFHGNRSIVFGAMSSFEAATGGTAKDFTPGQTGQPTLYNWANYYMMQVKKKRNCATCIIESYANIGGGNKDTLTETGATLWCNMLHAFVMEHLLNGHRPDRPVGYDQFLIRINEDNTKNLAAGGTLIDSETLAPIPWDGAYGLGGVTKDAPTMFRDCARPWYGYWDLQGVVHIRSGGTVSQDVILRMTIDGTLSGNYQFPKTIPSSTTESQPVSIPFQAFSQPTGDPDARTVRRFAFPLGKINGNTANNPRLARGLMKIRWVPFDEYLAPMPQVPLLP